jgi:hypothetical protein
MPAEIVKDKVKDVLKRFGDANERAGRYHLINAALSGLTGMSQGGKGGETGGAMGGIVGGEAAGFGGRALAAMLTKNPVKAWLIGAGAEIPGALVGGRLGGKYERWNRKRHRSH